MITKSWLVISMFAAAMIGGMKSIAMADTTTQPGADESLVIVQKTTVDRPGMKLPPGIQTIKVNGTRMRIDIDKTMSMIMLDDGSGIMLFHPTQMCIITSASRAKEAGDAAADQVESTDKQVDSDKKVKLQATGESQEINGYKANAYVFERPGMFGAPPSHVVYWIATDYPDADRLNAHQRMFKSRSNTGRFNAAAMAALSPEDMPKGFVVRIESDTPGIAKSVTDILSAKFAPVDDTDFEIPKDYKQQQAPVMPNGK